jgi:hypothetical protein
LETPAVFVRGKTPNVEEEHSDGSTFGVKERTKIDFSHLAVTKILNRVFGILNIDKTLKQCIIYIGSLTSL